MTLAVSSGDRPVEVVDEADRVGHALGVRVVGAEQHVVGADHAAQADRVVLVERVHEDVALEHLDRVLLEQVRVERRRPTPCRAGAGAPSRCRSRPGVIFRRGKRVHRPCPMAEATVSMIERCRAAGDGGEAGAAREGGELVVADALPLVDVALVAAVGGVHADDDVLLLHELPERVELGQGERAGAAEAGHRRRAHEDDLGAALGHPLELLDGLVDDREA